MGVSKQQEYVLFALGRCYEECDRRFANTPVNVQLSKMNFIELAREAGMVKKGVRALYKNLENLEKKKLVAYKNKSLKLTTKGEKVFHSLLKNVEPYIAVSLLLRSEDILKYTKVQAKFK